MRDDCQKRRTRQPRRLSSLLTSPSRFRLPRIFCSQYSQLDLGMRKFFGFPCQKSPSTNTATFRLVNTKSGRPGSFERLRQPAIPHRRIMRIRSNGDYSTEVRFIQIDKVCALVRSRNTTMQRRNENFIFRLHGEGINPGIHICRESAVSDRNRRLGF